MVNVNIVVKVELSGVILATYKNCLKIEGNLKLAVYKDRKTPKRL